MCICESRGMNSISAKISCGFLLCRGPFPCSLHPFEVIIKRVSIFANLFWVIEQKEIWGVYDVSNMCFIFFSFLVFQEVFWRENWAVFCLAGVVYIVPHPIFCHWGGCVPLWVCDNRGRYSQVSFFRGKALFPYGHSLDFRPTWVHFTHHFPKSSLSVPHPSPHV